LSLAASLDKEDLLTTPETLFLIAGRGRYPSLLIESARASGVKKISLAAFEGETAASTSADADEVHWMRVGQLGKLIDAARKSGARHAMMAGQLAPGNLFDLRPDVRALVLCKAQAAQCGDAFWRSGKPAREGGPRIA
jgi:DUF1009 family protein